MDLQIFQQIQGAIATHIQANHNNNNRDFSWNTVSSIYPNQFDLITFDVQEDKHFFYDDELHWIWYKNLNLPTFQIQVHSKESSPQEATNSIAKPMKAVLFACKEKINEYNLTSLNLSQLQGQTEKALVNSQCQFQATKFIDTSFKSKGQKFYLLIVIMSADQKNEILGMKITPQLYVVSRKKSHQERQTHFRLFDPFLPEFLEKVYLKMKPKKLGSLPIGCDMIGLANYFSTYCIRHKILHPYFLLLRFPQAVRIFYNHNIVEQDSQHLLQNIQKSIYQNLTESVKNRDLQDGEESQDLDDIDTPLEKKVMLVCIDTKQGKRQTPTIKKIAKFLQPLTGPAVEFSRFIPSTIPTCFKELKYNDNLKQNYSKCYQQIAQLKFTLYNNQDYQNKFKHKVQSMNVYETNPNDQQKQEYYRTIIELDITDIKDRKQLACVKVGHSYKPNSKLTSVKGDELKKKIKISHQDNSSQEHNLIDKLEQESTNSTSINNEKKIQSPSSQILEEQNIDDLKKNQQLIFQQSLDMIQRQNYQNQQQNQQSQELQQDLSIQQQQNSKNYAEMLRKYQQLQMAQIQNYYQSSMGFTINPFMLYQQNLIKNWYLMQNANKLNDLNNFQQVSKKYQQQLL